MADRPTGIVTLLFTDIEGSTRLLQQLGHGYGGVLHTHHRLLRHAIRQSGGIEVKTEGDSFFCVFRSPTDGLTAAVAAQRSLATEAWPDGADVRVRMGLHTGVVELLDGDYVGLDVHLAARIAAAAHGGQVLVSDSVRGLVADRLPEGVDLVDLGEHRLRDIERPERLHQLRIAGLRHEFPPPATLSSRLEVMPSALTSFIGRERQVADLERLLRDSRFITLTGPGGTGKTRLALAVAERARERFADGVVFVELAAITEPPLVAATVRRAIGEAEEPGHPASETVIRALATKELLLVLDNFEQVLDAAPFVAELLHDASRVSVVVTSRTVLHLSGEQEYAVPPLDLPDPVDAGDLDRMSSAESVVLFAQRARSARPGFAIDASNVRAVVEICRRLDGLPLAIELAASRIKLLPPEALLSRLGRRLDLLQATTADRTDRQRTLRGAIDWSYELLAADQQALFRRLAAFRGTPTIEAIESVVVAAGPVGDVLEGLAGLVDHSLVRQEAEVGEPRFRMLETIREFGLERLKAEGESAATLAAHARLYADLAAAAEPHLTSGPVWLDRLEREHDDIRAALAWLADTGDIETAYATAGSLWRFWHLRGHLREGSRRLRDLLGRVPGPTATRARAKALVGLAGLVYWMGDFEEATRRYEEAQAIAEAIGDAALEAEIQYSLGYVHGIHRRYDDALAALAAAHRLYETLANPLGAAFSQMAAGMIETLRGDHEAAVPQLRQATARFEALGEDFGMGNAMAVLGRALVHLGRTDEARSAVLDVIRRTSARRDPTALSAVLLDLASLEALDGHPERAARLLGAAERIVEEAGGEAPPPLINRIDPVGLLRDSLPHDRLDALRAEGRAWSTEEAVQRALGDGGGAGAA